MTELLILLVIVLTTAAVLAALRDVHDDGYGHRPPPPSHPRDGFEPRYPPARLG